MKKGTTLFLKLAVILIGIPVLAFMQANAQKQAAITIAEGEAEYMKKISEAYDTEEKQEFYSFLRGLDALKESLGGKNKTIILNRDSELVKVLYGEGLY